MSSWSAQTLRIIPIFLFITTTSSTHTGGGGLGKVAVKPLIGQLYLLAFLLYCPFKFPCIRPGISNLVHCHWVNAVTGMLLHGGGMGSKRPPPLITICAFIAAGIVPEQVRAEITEWRAQIVSRQHRFDEDQVVESVQEPEAGLRIGSQWKVSCRS